MATAQQPQTFTFELVSPEKILFSEQARMVVVPGTEGDFGVMAGHAPLLSSIRPGVVTVTLPDDSVKRIFVAGGFSDVSAEICTVLAEQAEDVDKMDKTKLEQKLRNLQDDLGFAKEDPSKTAHITREIELTRAKIAAAA